MSSGAYRLGLLPAIFILFTMAPVVHAAGETDVPRYVNDSSWPKPFPHHWVMGQIGGLTVDDHDRIWDALDKAREKHPDMVLLHGGSPRGAERIAACWAENRKVTQIAFKPDWTRHAKAAPFRRNDQLLSVAPYGLIVFPGSGITDNLADKARRLGIPVWRFAEGGA